MKNVFIIGSKGIPSNYGGFETFVEKLTEYNYPEKTKIKYHVSCLSDNEEEFEHNGARCFNVNVPDIGPAKAIYYDIAALKKVIAYIEVNDIKDAIVYVLACRIGPFIGYYKRQLRKHGASLLVNPDGHEWKRAKWNRFIRKYWKLSEKLMVKHADLMVCDSLNIEKYILEDYKQYNPQTTYIAYGADSSKSNLSDSDQVFIDWLDKYKIRRDEYYLIVGRFVPENNYEAMIRQYMKSKTTKDLVIITNVEQNKFYDNLLSETQFIDDSRIKFVGTVYNQELLKKIRQEAYGYLHGHEVGGTNPSLLEALAFTKLNLLLDVGFNSEVAQQSALYWNKENLFEVIEKAEKLTENEIAALDRESQNIILNRFSWEKISTEYTRLFR